MALQFLPDVDFAFKGISNFTFGITENCNMRCRYCCFSGEYTGLRSHSPTKMSAATVEKSIAFVRANAHKTDDITVSFYGGEALLEFETIKLIIRELRGTFGERISFDISTNGLMLTKTVIEEICRLPDTGVSVSLDACRQIHDRRRLGADSSHTFDRIINNLKAFKDHNPGEYQRRIRLMVTFESLDEIEEANQFYPGFKELLGDKGAHISRVMPNFDKGLYLPDSMEKKRRALREALRKRELGEVDFHSLWLADLERKVRKRISLHTGNGRIRLHTCLNSLYSIFITSEGMLYPCEKFGTDSCIGNLDSGIDYRLLRKTAILYTLRRQALCGKCEFAEYCGRCPADLKLSSADMRKMCEDYKNDITNYLEWKHETSF